MKYFNLLSHPQSKLQFAWNCSLWGWLLLPIVPPLAALALFIGGVAAWRVEWRSLVRDRLCWVLGVLTVWLVATSCLAVNPVDSWLGLGNFIPFFLLFAAWSRLIQTPRQLRQIAFILVFCSIPVAILGCGQLWGSWATPPEIEPFLGWVLVKNGEPAGRISSVFMHANTLGAYLQLVFILGLGLWLEEIDTIQSKSRKVINWVAIGLSVSLILNAIVLIFTNSRNAWGLTALACFVFALYRGWTWLVGAIIAAIGAIAWSAFGLEPGRSWLRKIIPIFLWGRLSDELYPDRPLALQRTTQWRFAWDLTLTRPGTGWGLRNFASLYFQKTQTHLNHPHNLWLMLTAETGMPATLLFLGAIAFILSRGVLAVLSLSNNRLILFTYLIAFVGLVLFNMVDVSIFDFRSNTFGWLILSAIWGVARQHKI